jgi:hypothetical protein
VGRYVKSIAHIDGYDLHIMCSLKAFSVKIAKILILFVLFYFFLREVYNLLHTNTIVQCNGMQIAL